MSTELRDLSRIGDTDAYRVLIDVAKRYYVFVVRISRTPIFGMSAPHSFWDLCERQNFSGSTILEHIQRLDRGEKINWPVVLEGRSTPMPEQRRYWSSKSSCSIPSESLTSAAAYLAEYPDTSLFPRAFEFKIVKQHWDELAPLARSFDLYNYQLGAYKQMIVPKASAGTRVATHLDPLDTLLLTALVFQLGPVMERARIPANEHVVHSFRVSQNDEQLWDSRYGFRSFRKATRDLASRPDSQFIAETDISAFYHNVPVEAVTQALAHAGAPLPLVEVTRGVLTSFSTRGLPVGPAASSFFAEAVLNSVDHVLRAVGARFVRFNDDYRFFCKSETEARARLQTLSDLLWSTAKLSIQGTKTRIYSRSQFSKISEDADWLAHLRTRIRSQDPYSDSSLNELVSSDQDLVASARAVLLSAIDPSRPAWIRLCREALTALPIRQRLDLMPRMIAQFQRLKPIAKELSFSISGLGIQQRHARAELLDAVTTSINEDEQSPDGDDYGRTWIMRSFNSADWPGVDKLISTANRWPEDRSMKRELLLCLRHHSELARRLPIDQSDSWQRRAALYVGVLQPKRSRGESALAKWRSVLDAAIAGSGDGS